LAALRLLLFKLPQRMAGDAAHLFPGAFCMGTAVPSAAVSRNAVRSLSPASCLCEKEALDGQLRKGLARQFRTCRLCRLFSSPSGLLGNDSTNYGSLQENFASEELTAHVFGLYCLSSRALGALDFVIVKDGRAVPVVVKSGKSHPRHSALRKVLSGGGSGIREAYVLWNGNVRADGRITYLPAYMAMFIRNE